MIRRPPRDLRIDPAETQLAEIKFVDKDVNHPNRIVLINPVIQTLWKSVDCPPSTPSTKRPIRSPTNPSAIISCQAFSHSQGRLRSISPLKANGSDRPTAAIAEAKWATAQSGGLHDRRQPVASCQVAPSGHSHTFRFKSERRGTDRVSPQSRGERRRSDGSGRKTPTPARSGQAVGWSGASTP